MPSQPGFEAITPWRQSSSGRQYRTVTFQGRQYTQWDDERGTLSQLNNQTPRTTDPRNQTSALGPAGQQARGASYQPSGYPQQASAYHTSLFPNSAPPANTNAPAAQLGEARMTSYQTQYSGSRSSHDGAYLYGLQQDPRYVTSPTSPTLARGTESQVGDRALTGANRLSGASCNSPISPQPTSPSSTLDRSRTYPPGTRRVVSRDGQTYCFDENNRILDQWPMRRESEPAPRPSSLDTRSPPSNPPATRPAAAAEGNRLSPTRFIERQGKSMEKFFVRGRVLAMLWHENAGSRGTQLSEASRRGPYQQDIITKTRRMVLVKKMHGFSWCIPIHTYSGQGVTKRGLSREDIERHAVIYMQGTKSQPRQDERGLVKEPIAVKPASPDQKLDPMSRLNFGKPYTVEHNIKAMEVGMVTDKSMPYLVTYFQNVCNEQP
ncbi:hypothetical protein EPUS_01642 [Endocarpon pusillum Z07020]|uniref:DUF6590 domain-containing protein n=1 Tax=Endocarpon pusillum (strain Z07020 / HMAS-L-300199) TaxID=1263415 RepID=U1GDX8_ENDPU|nr:uncharacterized protein EPUS_01642 [Endocarpon pusillum Z07020]ERF75812.1 hypothetical protein EPUS_01642 [Endocarpon pusillum Z07020]